VTYQRQYFLLSKFISPKTFILTRNRRQTNRQVALILDTHLACKLPGGGEAAATNKKYIVNTKKAKKGCPNFAAFNAFSMPSYKDGITASKFEGKRRDHLKGAVNDMFVKSYGWRFCRSNKIFCIHSFQIHTKLGP
jgi:hypothetical protein